MPDVAVTGKELGIGSAIFEWRSSLSLARKIALALCFACVTGLMAQARIPLPWTPVPITGQTLAVLLAGLLLGRWWGGISQMVYLGVGVLGVPWFAGWSGGHTAVLGPTGGYLLGFIPAALFVGYFADRPVRRARFQSFLVIMLIADFGLIHLPGLVHLRLWYSLVTHEPVSLSTLLFAGTIPFVAGDLIKILAASGIAAMVAPGRSKAS